MAKKRKKRKKRSYAAKPAYTPFMRLKDSFMYKRSLYIIVFIVGFTVFAAIAGVIYIADNYTIKNVDVLGSTHYSTEEIEDMVMTDSFCHNSIFLAAKYRNKSIEDVPFVEKIDVDIVSKDTVEINVYEKAIAGYIAYLGRYMYFDREGMVVESSLEASDDVPQVMGLDIAHVVLHEKLPIDEDHRGVFEQILNVTQLLDKHELHADKIFFDDDYNLYLYFGGVEVSLGKADFIDEKIMQLPHILPSLEGKTGILNLEEYNEDNKITQFEPKNQGIVSE